MLRRYTSPHMWAMLHHSLAGIISEHRTSYSQHLHSAKLFAYSWISHVESADNLRWESCTHCWPPSPRCCYTAIDIIEYSQFPTKSGPRRFGCRSDPLKRHGYKSRTEYPGRCSLSIVVHTTCVVPPYLSPSSPPASQFQEKPTLLLRVPNRGCRDGFHHHCPIMTKEGSMVARRTHLVARIIFSNMLVRYQCVHRIHTRELYASLGSPNQR
jgi:hypothetical protein